MMQRRQHANGVITYSFASFSGRPVQAYVSTRHGGVSPAPWSSLNFSVARGDSPERVAANRARFAEAVGIDQARVISCQQVHGTRVVRVGISDCGSTHTQADALITDSVGVPLRLVFADCVPVAIYDPMNHALGICHAGWRGTISGAAVATLQAMQETFGSAPGEVLAAIGPSIGPESYEVGPEVVAQAEAELPEAGRYFHYPNGPASRPHFDLWRANAGQLAAAGVPTGQIEISGIDTARHTDDFFSHRGEQGRCGLFGMTAWLCERDEVDQLT